jgi:hypothetical protein
VPARSRRSRRACPSPWPRAFAEPLCERRGLAVEVIVGPELDAPDEVKT